MKSYAPLRMAETAVSMLPKAVITTTGISGRRVVDLLTQFQAARSGHLDVGQHDIKLALTQQLHRFIGGLAPCGFVPSHAKAPCRSTRTSLFRHRRSTRFLHSLLGLLLSVWRRKID